VYSNGVVGAIVTTITSLCCSVCSEAKDYVEQLSKDKECNIPPRVPENPTCRKLTPVATFPSDRIIRATLTCLLLASNTISLSCGKFAGNIMAANQGSS
jgi:5-methylcytosine-specific restriction endonuclease McrA